MWHLKSTLPFSPLHEIRHLSLSLPEGVLSSLQLYSQRARVNINLLCHFLVILMWLIYQCQLINGTERALRQQLMQFLFFNIQKKIKSAVTRLASHTSGRLWPLRRHSTDVKVKVFISKKKKRLRTIYGCYDFQQERKGNSVR